MVVYCIISMTDGYQSHDSLIVCKLGIKDFPSRAWNSMLISIQGHESKVDSHIELEI